MINRFDSTLLVVWLETFVRFGAGLVVLPIAVATLGDVELSLWLLFGMMMGLALLADSGLSPTLLRATAYFRAGAMQIPASFSDPDYKGAHGEPNWDGIQGLIATSRRLYLLVGIGSAVLVGVIGGAAVWNLMSMAEHSPRFWIAFGLLVLWACIQVQVVRWAGILQGLGKVLELKRIDLMIGLAKIVGFAALLMLGQGLLGVTCVGLAIAVINCIVTRTAVLRSLPPLSSKPKQFDQELARSLWPATWRLGLMSWGSYGVYNGGAIVVAQLPDAALVASYLLTLRIISLISATAQAPIVAYRPNVISALAERDLDRFRSLTIKIIRLSLSVYCMAALALVLAGDRVLVALGSETQLVPIGILLLLLLAYLLEVHHSIHCGLYIGTNDVPFVGPALASGAAIVGVGFIVVEPFGILGIVLVQITVQALCNNWLPVYLSLRLTRWRFVDYVLAVLRTEPNFGKLFLER